MMRQVIFRMIISVAMLAVGVDSRPFLSQTTLVRGGSSNWSARQATPLRPPQQSQPATQSSDRAVAKEMMDAFLTRDSRQSFIARVYAILAVQLLVTAASITIWGTQPQLVQWMRLPGTWGSFVPLVSLLLSTGCWYTMAVSSDARRKSPLKWRLLALFTAGEALSVGFVSSFYTFTSVLSAMLATAAATAAISLYTLLQKNPKYDLSQWGAALSSCGLIFVVYGLIQLLSMVGILPPDLLPYSEMLYGLAGACLFSLYLAYHTKLIVAGKHSKYQMNENDYVFGAMTLYNDIINLFVYTLRVIGEDREH